MSKLTIDFDNDNMRWAFLIFLSDAGGEDGFDSAIKETFGGDKSCEYDYSRCFPSYGYVPKKHGDPKITIKLVKED